MNMYNTKILQYWGRQHNFGILTALPLQRQLGASLCILYYELTNLNLFLFFLLLSLRIHQDKSFHCEVCNVCLDKRLEGNHKCRPDSGHDECCICLEVSLFLPL